jgi:hypothetical protein
MKEYIYYFYTSAGTVIVRAKNDWEAWQKLKHRTSISERQYVHHLDRSGDAVFVIIRDY